MLTLAALAPLAAGCGKDSTAPDPAAGGRQPLAAPRPASAAPTPPNRAPRTPRGRPPRSAGDSNGCPGRSAGAGKKPRITTREGFEVDGHRRLGLPPVFTTVPTDEKVVFLTIDDGAEKDPAFLRMMSELKIPYTAFLSDYVIKEDYGYFEEMRDRGVGLNNHTLNHPPLRGLSYARQKREICGMQDVVEERYGHRPVLFRPPFGTYDKNTLRAAKSCGVEYVPLWNEEVFVDRWDYREGDGSCTRRHRPHPLPGPERVEGHDARHDPPLPGQGHGRGVRGGTPGGLPVIRRGRPWRSSWRCWQC
ncbi:polysaccharide deacetylase family protein [Streptomyces sp. INA 01156]